MINKAIYPGMFDPLTNGHLDLVTRSSQMFNWVVLAVFEGSSKQPMFSLSERVSLASQVTSHLSNVIVIGFNSLIVELAVQQQADVLIRGVRAIEDFEYELQLARMNRHLMPTLETIFMIPAEKWSYVSSTLVKEVALNGGNIDHFLPELVAKKVKCRLHP